MSTWGGRREGAGRKPGVPNKVSGEIREVARQFGPSCIQRLAEFAGLIEGERAETHAAQIAAIKELLDRGYGRATMPVAGDSSAPLVVEFSWASEPSEPRPEPMLTIDSSSECAEEADTEVDIRWSC
jgi:hypothetical protein